MRVLVTIAGYVAAAAVVCVVVLAVLSVAILQPSARRENAARQGHDPRMVEHLRRYYSEEDET